MRGVATNTNTHSLCWVFSFSYHDAVSQGYAVKQVWFWSFSHSVLSSSVESPDFPHHLQVSCSVLQWTCFKSPVLLWHYKAPYSDLYAYRQIFTYRAWYSSMKARVCVLKHVVVESNVPAAVFKRESLQYIHISSDWLRVCAGTGMHKHCSNAVISVFL